MAALTLPAAAPAPAPVAAAQTDQSPPTPALAAVTSLPVAAATPTVPAAAPSAADTDMRRWQPNTSTGCYRTSCSPAAERSRGCTHHCKADGGPCSDACAECRSSQPQLLLCRRQVLSLCCQSPLSAQPLRPRPRACSYSLFWP